jgi:hypothetical protein
MGFLLISTIYIMTLTKGQKETQIKNNARCPMGQEIPS